MRLYQLEKSIVFTQEKKRNRSHHMPKDGLMHIIDLCANNCLYSSLDLQGFHQIPIEKTHCERTAFASRVFIYVDDLIVTSETPEELTSETPEEYLVDIDEVLFRPKQRRIRPKPEKAQAIDNYPTPKNPTEMRNCNELLKEALTLLSVTPRLGYFCHRNGQSRNNRRRRETSTRITLK
ncbi:unnamed protein product [Strongylus vulgaris]|uniref:Reverse transcriptase domain-containing protein n=1 Tax=Strongylus vulgaris TaxID=40348 RepID=A0A3P7IP78_STRVU|nr:unnamed protein product [Strongylus vulgaris]